MNAPHQKAHASPYWGTLNLPHPPWPAHALPRVPRRVVPLPPDPHAPGRILTECPAPCHGRLTPPAVRSRILKDGLIKWWRLQGETVIASPRWEAYDRALEMDSLRHLPHSPAHLNPLRVRGDCMRRADQAGARQARLLAQLGIGTFDALTVAPPYEAAALATFARAVDAGLITREALPVSWCPQCQLTLAKAELEALPVRTDVSWIAFPVTLPPPALAPHIPPSLVLVTWTAQPWLLPGVTGLGVHPDATYLLVHDALDREAMTYILSIAALPAFTTAVGLRAPTVSRAFPGSVLSAGQCAHPLTDAPVPVLASATLSPADGAGIHLLTPGCDPAALRLARVHDLPILDPIDAAGRFSPASGLLAGHSLAQGVPKLLSALDQSGTLLAHAVRPHSLLHCWRCRQPILTRRVPQWLLQTAPLVPAARTLVATCRCVPVWGAAYLDQLLATRPDWCLSRQRPWGVPIPAFACATCGDAFVSADGVARGEALVRAEGAGGWYRHAVADLLPEAQCPRCGDRRLEKGPDVFDPQFVASCSPWATASGEPVPAALALESVEHYRGWLAGVLLVAALRGEATAPVQTIVTHMTAQSVELPPHWPADPLPTLLHRWGSDTVRWWAWASALHRPAHLRTASLAQAARSVARCQAYARFLLGVTADCRPDALPAPEVMCPPDRWVLHRLTETATALTQHYAAVSLPQVCTTVLALLRELSRDYLPEAKERLYLLAPDAPARRSAQAACYWTARWLAQWLAPIAGTLAEAIWAHLPGTPPAPSVFASPEPAPPASWAAPALGAHWRHLRRLRGTVARALARAQRAGTITTARSAELLLYSGGETNQTLELLVGLLPGLLQVAAVHLHPRADAAAPFTCATSDLAIVVRAAPGQVCPRCRWTRPRTAEAPGEVCAECAESLAFMSAASANQKNARRRV